jgi:hypothetical protein
MVQLSFGLWWEGLSTFTKIYWMISIPASAIFAIQLTMSILVPKADKIQLTTSNNSSVDTEIPITFQLISFRNLIGFFTSFGWSGLACIDSGLLIAPTILISFICGLLTMLAMATILYYMTKLMKTVEEDM